MTVAVLRLIPLDVPVTLTREQARQLAEAELAKAKYGGLPDWLPRLLARIGDWLIRLLTMAGPGTGSRTLVIVVAVLLVIAIALVLWRVGLPRLRSRQTEPEVDLDPTRDADSYRTQAAAAAEAGDFRTAIGDRFRALVRELEMRTILDPRPARTAREVAVVAGVTLREQRHTLDAAAALFGEAWYGDEPADLAGYQQMCRFDADLTAAAERADLGDLPDESELVGSGPTGLGRRVPGARAGGRR